MREAAAALVRVVHRDDHLLVLYKPPGLPTTSPDGRNCLVERAADLDPSAPRLHPSSRLDADVSGLVTFARTRRATRALLDARRGGVYVRVYTGIAAAVPSPDEGVWDGPIGIDARDKRKRAVAGATAKPARTLHRVIDRAAGGTCLLELRPHTGRTHQLRVHAAHAGAPLLGDTVYGGPKRVTLPDGRVVTARRVMLHCTALSIPDVAAGTGTLDLREELQEDMRRVWDALRSA